MVYRQAGVSIKLHYGTGQNKCQTAAIAVATMGTLIIKEFYLAVHFGYKIKSLNVVLHSGTNVWQIVFKWHMFKELIYWGATLDFMHSSVIDCY